MSVWKLFSCLQASHAPGLRVRRVLCLKAALPKGSRHAESDLLKLTLSEIGRCGMSRRCYSLFRRVLAILQKEHLYDVYSIANVACFSSFPSFVSCRSFFLVTSHFAFKWMGVGLMFLMLLCCWIFAACSVPAPVVYNILLPCAQKSYAVLVPGGSD